MTLKATIDSLAERLTRGEAGDLKHVVDVQDAFQHLKQELERAELEEALLACNDALEAIGSILWQESDAPEGDYAFLREVVYFVAQAAEALQGGATVELQRPLRDRPAGTEVADEPAELIDMELLGMFLACCEENLETIERLAMEIEESANEESISHLRRVVHTIKGEFGVLSLQTAQHVFHVAEDRLDEVLSSGHPFPAEGILALSDWLKEYTGILEQDPSSDPPDAEAVFRAFGTEGTSSEGQHADPAAQAGHPAASDSAPVAAVTSRQASVAAEGFLPGHADADPIVFNPDVFDDPMIGDVLSESRGHLEDAEAAMLELEVGQDGSVLIDRIFRAFHTIKGVAGFMNLTPIVGVAYWSETLLDDFRKGYQVYTDEHVNLILRSRDLMAQLFDALTGDTAPSVGVARQLLSELETATVGEGGTSPAPASRSTSAASPAPAPTAGEGSEGSDAEPPPQTPAEESVAEVQPQAARKEPAGPSPAPPKEAGKPRSAPKIEQSVKVGTRRLDQLVDMVGELVIAQQMVSQDETLSGIRSERLTRNLAQVAKITRDLQESAMSLRMVPLRSTFQKMSRLVRDVSRKAGRSVSLEIVGEDTELDRTVVEEIGDPLIHLIRNAVDHGLEPPDERAAAGKSSEGRLTLRAYHQGGSIVIEIADDGRGLNREKLLAKANERGVLPPGVRGEDMADADVFKLIFAPGFSTAEKVTDISGRGVGMDVVRRNIEALRGRIDITSELGVGTTFYLRLPLTLAIIDGMIVRVGTTRYVVPTLAIEQSFRPSEAQLHGILEEGLVVQVRDSLLSVRSLRELFQIEEGTEDPTEGILMILEAHGDRTCVLVDEILYQHQVVIKSISRAVPVVDGISGAAILGDGTVALILDVDGLLQSAPQAVAQAT